eukprot:scaffold4001_cov141-Chaetoceros_neogracile.AAC.1
MNQRSLYPCHPILQAYINGRGKINPNDLLVGLNQHRVVQQEEEDEDTEAYIKQRNLARKRYLDEVEVEKLPKKKRAKRNPNASTKLFVRGSDGKIRRGIPTDCLWWVNYVEFHEDVMKHDLMRLKFRLRFRMPFDTWRDFVIDLKRHDNFRMWHDGNSSAWGVQSSPIELLSLGALRYLGRKCTFDDLAENTFISERTHSRFFEAFIKFGSTSLYEQYVRAPQTPAEAASHMHEMTIAGFPGAVGSGDATNIIIENCRYGLRQSHLGAKLNKTARTYNIVSNHRKRILHSTAGHPSRWNDKTVVLFDEFIMGLHNGEILADNSFELFERDSSGRILVIKYKGAWILVDNGYLRWSVTIPPFKHCSAKKMIRWSQWLESMRKDVECTFGILKKRWTILSKGIQAKKIQNADMVWKTCCALHNMLLEIDGLDELWQDSVKCNDAEDNDIDEPCFALSRLNNPDVDEYNLARGRADNDSTDDEMNSQSRNEQELMIDGSSSIVTEVRKMPQEAFRQKLVEHFDILFEQNEISWPKRLRKPRKL